MKEFKIHDSFELIEERDLKDLSSKGLLLSHKKTKARIALILNDDENKVFYIGFRTPPKDSTGVAHIIEHTVLCGSEKYPLKDPFVELMKGSLNTFLNAMTYPDKTVYPVASCNDTDFQNLCSVYMDAVLRPNIYKDERIFKQEGWHYELESGESELKLNGVVYNEMKGAMSLPDRVLNDEILSSLYPDTTYAINSGGDPDFIPDLTYENYLEFHRTYYHPSNSYIFLYGDIDVYEKLEWLDREYLSRYDYLEVDSKPEIQKPFDRKKDIRKPYSVMEDDSVTDNGYLSYNICIRDEINVELLAAFDVLDYALCSAPGAVLRQALLDEGVCDDVYTLSESGLRQPFFSVVCRGSDESKKELFLDTIQKTLEKVEREGFDKKTLLAAINSDEFRFFEADFGSAPKGLVYGLKMLDSWLYDDKKPWSFIDIKELYSELKKKVQTNYYEELLRKYILDNTHKSVVSLYPERGLSSKKEKEITKMLAEKKAGMSDDEINRLIEETEDLKRWQQTPETEENKLKIPRLTRADLKREAEPFFNEERMEGDVRVLFHDIQTNGGICYINFIFDMEHVPEDLFKSLGLFRIMLGLVDTGSYSYTEFSNEINIHTGGLSTSFSLYPGRKDADKFIKTFEIGIKLKKEEMSKGFELIKEMIGSSKFDDDKRFKEIIEEARASFKDSMSYRTDRAAASRALYHISRTSIITSITSGYETFKLIEKLDDDSIIGIRLRAKEAKKLKKLTELLFRPENMLLDITATEDGYEAFAKEAGNFSSCLFDTPAVEGSFEPVPEKANEAFQTAGQVQFVARAGNYLNKGLEYTGALHVLRVLLNTDYLWNKIRVLGGAYGASASFGRNGDSYFVSYRDPNLKNSIDVFEKASEYIRNFEADERTLTGFVISAISDMDVPKTPSIKGNYALIQYMTGTSCEDLQKVRNEILDITAEQLKDLSKYIDAFMSDEQLCVIGTAEAIEENRELFDKIDKLFHDDEKDIG